jgi:hypothetical protein
VASADHAIRHGAVVVTWIVSTRRPKVSAPSWGDWKVLAVLARSSTNPSDVTELGVTTRPSDGSVVLPFFRKNTQLSSVNC